MLHGREYLKHVGERIRIGTVSVSVKWHGIRRKHLQDRLHFLHHLHGLLHLPELGKQLFLLLVAKRHGTVEKSIQSVHGDRKVMYLCMGQAGETIFQLTHFDQCGSNGLQLIG